MNARTQLVAGGLALACLLVYTLVHTGGLLAAYVRPPFVGYIAAFGIELSVVSLSLRIGDLKRTRQNPAFFVSVLLAVVLVSAIANIAEGFQASTGLRLTLDTARRMDALQAAIALTATGLVSLIVLALAEIVGTDVNQAVREEARKRKAQRPAASTSSGIEATPEQAARARAVKAVQDAATKAARLDALLETLAAEPEARPTGLARRLNISRTTLYSYLNELTEAGRLHRNGNGWEVRR